MQILSYKLFILHWITTIINGFPLLSTTSSIQTKSGTLAIHSHSHTQLYAYKSIKRGGGKVSLKKAAKLLANVEEGKQINTSKKNKRTRKRVSEPKQSYVYACQRRKQEQDESDESNSDNTSSHNKQVLSQSLVNQVKTEFGFNVANQHCHPIIHSSMVYNEPRIMAEIQVSNDGENIGTNSKAYIIEKPPGWMIMASKLNTKKNINTDAMKQDDKLERQQQNEMKTKEKEEQDNEDIQENDNDFEYDMEDVLAMLTPQERAEMEMEMELQTNTADIESKEGSTKKLKNNEKNKIRKTDLNHSDRTTRVASVKATFQQNERPSVLSWLKEVKALENEPIRISKKYWTILSGASSIDDSGLVLLCPTSQISNLHINEAQYLCIVGNGGELVPSSILNRRNKLRKKELKNYVPSIRQTPEGTSIQTLSKLRKGRISDTVITASIKYTDGLSFCDNVVDTVQSYYKDSIRGDVNACPLDIRANRRLIHCDTLSVSSLICDNDVTISLLHGEEEEEEDNNNNNNDLHDFEISNEEEKEDDDDDDDDDDFYEENNIDHIQEYDDSSTLDTNTDKNGLPLNKRDLRNEIIPDDIAIWTNIGGIGSKFKHGSFIGRSALSTNAKTNAYREINGAADGYPGWIVDRYDKWLFIQHDQSQFKGPIPSIHDGNTIGVYYFGSTPNRADISQNVKPILLEGKGAHNNKNNNNDKDNNDDDDNDDYLVIEENGVKYMVHLSNRLSTGIFLDQRPQRAWLLQNCNEKTRVLNCFAHCGAYSVAAAKAGASTVSLDLEKAWLDRVFPQMALNGVTDSDLHNRHDCIYGDCFDWLKRLNKRGEQFDIVILDPPSTSVGKKKKRWSVKQDMDELVALAAPLVKSGGLMWTTNNCSTIRPERFARMCKRGFEQAGRGGFQSKLERIAPMPMDFPSIGPQPVTNMVWRLQ